jgi:hypothetical protein
MMETIMNILVIIMSILAIICMLIMIYGIIKWFGDKE